MTSDDDSTSCEDAPAICDYIVGIGASAGGLEALQELVAGLPGGSSFAYVVIQHLSPDFDSQMVGLLARTTSLTVVEATDGARVEEDTIYVLPPGKEMIIDEDTLILTDRPDDEALNLPIDVFFRSLALSRRRFAVAIVLSGTGADGSRGLADVNAEGGLVMAQTPSTAGFAGMPESAIDTDLVDLVLPPAQMGSALRTYAAEGLTPAALAAQEMLPGTAEVLAPLFERLQDDFGVDFTEYKPSTIGRRIERRRVACGSADLRAYVELALDSPEELAQLHGDLLIGVTRFRRDPEAFRAFEREVLAPLLDEDDGTPARIWVAGCSTGEEAYSVAIAAHEVRRRRNSSRAIKVFATDVDDEALTAAGAGLFERKALESFDQEAVKRYFEMTAEGLRASRSLRDSIVFAKHDLLSKPPFTRMHVIVCRNVLIYFQPHAQKRLLSLFHFSLRRRGVLFLGPSETVGPLDDEFETLSSRWRIYRKRRDVRLPGAGFRSMPDADSAAIPPPVARLAGLDGGMEVIYGAILDRHLEPSALVDDEFHVLHLFGGLENSLRLRGGRISTLLLDLVGEELRSLLGGALGHAQRSGTDVSYSGVRLPGDLPETQREMVVSPVSATAGGRRVFLIKFSDTSSSSGDGPAPRSFDEREASASYVASLEQDLLEARQNLQATVEELEASNEELQATNEELVASNEELQSTNEELQSVNEELLTVNVEHEQRIEQVSRERADMANLLAVTGVGVIFVDLDLKIRRFTPAIGATFDLLETDLGRSLATFAHSLDVKDLVERVASVLDSREVLELETTDAGGTTYLLRALPYERDQQIMGAVLTLVDVSVLQELSKQVQRFEPIVQFSSDAHLLLDSEGRIVFANHAFGELIGKGVDEVLEEAVPTSLLGPAGISYKDVFDRVHREGPTRQETELETPAGRTIPVELSASPVEIDGERLLFAHARDISTRRNALRYGAFVRDLAIAANDVDSLDGFFDLALSLARAQLDAVAGEVRLSKHASSAPSNVEASFGDPGTSITDEFVDRAWQTGGVFWVGSAPGGAVPSEGPSPAQVCAFRFLIHGQPRGLVILSLRERHGFDAGAFEQACDAASRTFSLVAGRISADRELRLRDRAMEASVDGICIADVEADDMPLVYVNSGFEQMTGYPAAEVLGRNCRFLQGPETSAETRSEIRRAIEERRPHRATILNYRKNGERFWNDIQLTPVEADDGVVRQFVAVQHDITERIETERDLQAARMKAASASRAKSRFLATISHEIRSPMAAIVGFTDMLRREVESGTGKEALAGIGRNADYLLSLIADILDISKIEAGKLQVNLRRFSLPETLRDVEGQMSHRAAEKTLDFTMALDGPIPWTITSDPTRLRQILINLIGNAIKFTDSGSVTTTIRALAEPQQLLEIEITDTGIGISPEDQERVFKPFVRPHVEADDSVKYDGAGLGLAIVHRLVKAMDGQITLRSRVGDGTTFTLRLPIELEEGTGTCEDLAEADEQLSDTAESSDVDEVDLSGTRVLLADDRPDLLRVISFHLEDAGAAVTTAGDGLVAAESFAAAFDEQKPFDLVILDVQMPVRDGLQATRDIRRLSPEVPIIALTAGATQEEQSEALTAGCSAFMSKPAEEDALLELIACLLGRDRNSS